MNGHVAWFKSVDWGHRARLRKATGDELAAQGLTLDSPRDLWPDGTSRRIQERARRLAPPPS